MLLGFYNIDGFLYYELTEGQNLPDNVMKRENMVSRRDGLD